jgi:hypothetical protein
VDGAGQSGDDPLDWLRGEREGGGGSGEDGGEGEEESGEHAWWGERCCGR